MSPPCSDPFGTEIRSGPLDAALDALSAGWEAGRNPPAETFAQAVAEEGNAAIVELVYHEFCLAESAGLAPDPAVYVARFPELHADLARLFGLHDALDDLVLRSWSTPAGPPPLPDSGDTIGPYHLLRELGRGGLARVFLAEQSDLGDRLVVLKVSARPSPEAMLQARARHPHIVEVLRQAETGDGGLHLIAMPFLGGATLASVLSRESSEARWFTRRSGRSFVAALDHVAAPEFLKDETVRSASRDLVAGLSRTAAAAWIVARLAEALDHANRLGISHGDLKPANILIAADARPMLFDFNLAADWRSPLADLASPTGGTLAYMAPERLRALAEPKSAPIPRPSDLHRADLYALGLVLREILTGRPPEMPNVRPSEFREAAAAMAEAREHAGVGAWSASRGVPASLRAILAHCLAPDPTDRYGGMIELAEDLDRWREGLAPLHAGAPRRDVSRWIVRHRAPLAIAGAVLVAAVVVGSIAWSASTARMRKQAEIKLAAFWDSGDPSVIRGRRFGAWNLEDELVIESARRNLERYGVMGSEDWRDRDDVQPLGESDRIDLEMWLVEQAWRLASAWSRRPDAPDDHRRALALLERSPEWAELRAFTELRGTLRSRLGLPEPPASRNAPPKWLDDYASGLAAEATGPKVAAAIYAKILAERSEALWPRYRAAAMAGRLGDLAGAADALAICLQRRPDNPAFLTQMAGCLLESGRTEEAMAACDRAVAKDPDYRDAYMVRSLVRLKVGQTSEAQRDIERFVALSRNRPAEAAAGGLTFEDRAGREAKGRLSDAAEVQALVATKLEIDGRTAEAITAYARAIDYDRDDLRSRARRAHLLFQEHHNEGINEMAEVIEDPRFEELVGEGEPTLRLAHYVVEYRLLNGAAAEARLIAENALAMALKLRREGTPKSTIVAESRYALARALAPGAASNPAVACRVADLLKAASRVDHRFLDEKFPGDPLFKDARDPINKALQPSR